MLPLLLLSASCVPSEIPPPAKPAPRPLEIGTFFLGGAGSAAPPVLFEHWRHRARYTCRLCHADLGFSMTRGGTGITAATNAGGYHCGACHNGKERALDKVAFPACADGPVAADCLRCHAGEQLAREDAFDQRQRRYDEVVRQLPRSAAGGIDWSRAVEERRIRLLDFTEGASPAGRKLTMDRDVLFDLQRAGGVVFSHATHVRWNGCELCHPQLFPTDAKASLGYRMQRLISGEHCGACHGKVAFALTECDRCHTDSRGG
jgi:c(7)-type cytochrome triheme protein